jgi:hypothetical protein
MSLRKHFYPYPNSRIRALVSKYRTSIDVELQQRSNESVTIWSLERDIR